MERSAAEIKRPARGRPPAVAPVASYPPFDHHPLATGQTGFTRFSSPNISEHPSQSGMPVTPQSSRPTSSTPLQQHMLQNANPTPPLVRTPSSHRKSPPTMPFGAESASSFYRPLSFDSQSSSGPSGLSGGNAQPRPQHINEIWERGDSVDQRPLSVSNDVKLPIAIPEERPTTQQTGSQSMSTHNVPSAPSSSSDWNPWNGLSTERPLSPADSPPRYEMLAP